MSLPTTTAAHTPPFPLLLKTIVDERTGALHNLNLTREAPTQLLSGPPVASAAAAAALNGSARHEPTLLGAANVAAGPKTTRCGGGQEGE